MECRIPEKLRQCKGACLSGPDPAGRRWTPRPRQPRPREARESGRGGPARYRAGVAGADYRTDSAAAVVAHGLLRQTRARALAILGGVLALVVVLALGVGAVHIPPLQVTSILAVGAGLPAFAEHTDAQERIVRAIRLPRVVLGALIGAALAVSGAAMQGLFRNPLADPGLLGISGGASLAATASIVAGFTAFGRFSLPLAAFAGAVAATAAIYVLAQERGRVNVATMLLAGIALNALCGAVTGYFVYTASDDQLRTITFWQLGSLGGASWRTVAVAAPFLLACTLLMPFLANALNAMLLGESDARNLGVPVDAVKWVIVAAVALGVGAGVAVAGIIGFVGLVVPHMVRLWLGPNHRVLLPAAALLGATLLILADLLARTVIAPAELPIGIVTALVGAPFFLWLLLRDRRLRRLA